MKKPGLLALLEQLRVRSEQPTDEEMKQILRLELTNLLLDYINDPQVRAAADQVVC